MANLDNADIPRVRTIRELHELEASGWLIDLLRDERLTSVFQPIVHTGEPSKVLGHEILLRGIGGDGESLAPGPLFEAARGCGMLAQLDIAARRSAIRAAASHA